jgi:ubiquitin conjugation factor E4 B
MYAESSKAPYFLTVLQILYCSCFTFRGQSSLLGTLLNSHPVALKYLMPALTHFYIGMRILLLSRLCTAQYLTSEVEQTGASSQFYDKFSTLLIFKVYRLLTERRRTVG